MSPATKHLFDSGWRYFLLVLSLSTSTFSVRMSSFLFCQVHLCRKSALIGKVLLKLLKIKRIDLNIIGHVKEYRKLYYFGIPKNTHSMIAYKRVFPEFR